jgi:hypothetical protein
MKTIRLFMLCICVLLFPLYNPAHATKTNPKAKAETSIVPCTKFKAQLCNNCGFGNKKDNCWKCGKWVANNGVPAVLCNDCGFGNKKDNCAKCNKWAN